MNRFSRDLVQGMQEAAAFAEGKEGDARTHVVELSAEGYAHFLARLAEPPKPNDRLRRTMKTPPPWE